jgi:23S rRNA-/tRNA-specific pseudouridylate synthase
VNFKILFEDPDLVAVSKPSGWVVDGGTTIESLERALSEQLGRKVFPFHRIDRATSGIVLFGKTRVHSAAVTKAFESKLIRKSYLAVVEGLWKPEWNKIELPIEDKPARTTYRVLATSKLAPQTTLVEALPKTGRTHQIRIHCKSQGCPIVGDTFYNLADSRTPPLEQALHAYRLDFTHPGSKTLVSIVDFPEHWHFDWPTVLAKLGRAKI